MFFFFLMPEILPRVWNRRRHQERFERMRRKSRALSPKPVRSCFRDWDGAEKTKMVKITSCLSTIAVPFERNYQRHEPECPACGLTFPLNKFKKKKITKTSASFGRRASVYHYNYFLPNVYRACKLYKSVFKWQKNTFF